MKKKNLCIVRKNAADVSSCDLRRNNRIIITNLNQYKIPIALTLSQVFSETTRCITTYDIPADSAWYVDQSGPHQLVPAPMPMEPGTKRWRPCASWSSWVAFTGTNGVWYEWIRWIPQLQNILLVGTWHPHHQQQEPKGVGQEHLIALWDHLQGYMGYQ